jgi:hypothetical protein
MKPLTPGIKPVIIDALDAVELSEICELLDAWLANDPAAAASYDRHIGFVGQADELRAALRRHARTLTDDPEAAR